MATDPMQTYVVQCPSCKQKYAVNGVMIQDKEEVACQGCNSLFMLKLDGGKVGTTLVRPPTGSPLGPAEGGRKGRQ
jgi:DNA-directed RNA polymerase subunit RPC12/RpoP